MARRSCVIVEAAIMEVSMDFPQNLATSRSNWTLSQGFSLYVIGSFFSFENGNTLYDFVNAIDKQQNKEIYTRLQVGVMDVETLECKLA
ncbi:RmlC-like cupins superfamily protein [Prunus dulcis]|uniref:RmlC-like cupins superfamily protein n=1 Tax=Prunus dulcis TaxID=3755 RepID=A0A4Y1RZ32_PRUDU|nr:RmlC-like cupins superfamily protein [Prunus dulcis]